MNRIKFKNYVSAKEELNGELQIELVPNNELDELSRELNVAVYDKNTRLVINAVTDIDLLIANLQKIREELF